jgi:DNA polymerase III delta subunit
MLLALVGLDEFAKDERIAKFWKESLVDGSQRKVFFASDSQKDENFLVENIAQALTPSFFEPAASVLIRHCEFMFAEEQRQLVDFINGFSQAGAFQGNLALDFSELDKRSALWKLLDKSKAAEIFEPPKYSDAIQKWVVSHVKNHFGISINIAAAQYIADAIGGDTKRIHNEIKKILLYDKNIKEITMQHCLLFVQQNREIPAYELQDSFGFRNLNAFLPKFRRILTENGDEAFMPVVSALRNHCLSLLHIQAMKAKKIPDYEIRSKALPPNRIFLYDKSRMPEQSSCWKAGSLQKAILFLDELSYGKKTGRYRDLPSFELAICSLLYYL